MNKKLFATLLFFVLYNFAMEQKQEKQKTSESVKKNEGAIQKKMSMRPVIYDADSSDEELARTKRERSKSEKSKLERQKITLADLPGGIPREIADLIKYIKNREAFAKLSIRQQPINLLLYGPPGTGKTTLAQFIADETDSVFIGRTASSFMSSFQGASERNISLLFNEANEQAKSKTVILFIDEIDRLSGINIADTNGTVQRILSALLAGFDQRHPNIICILATNHLDKVPSEITTRFDRKVLVALPDEGARFNLLDHYIGSAKINTDNRLHFLRDLSEETEGLSRRELSRLVARAFEIATNRSTEKFNVMPEDFYVANSLILNNEIYSVSNRTKPIILIKYFLDDSQLTDQCIDNKVIIESEKETLSKICGEMNGLSSNIIENIVKSAFNLSLLRVKMKTEEKADKFQVKIGLNDFLVSIYSSQEIVKPTIETRKVIIEYLIRNFLHRDNLIDEDLLLRLAVLSNNFSGYRIKRFIIRSIELTSGNNVAEITNDHLYVAIYLEKSKDATEIEKTFFSRREGILNRALKEKDYITDILPDNIVIESVFRYYLNQRKHAISDEYLKKFAEGFNPRDFNNPVLLSFYFIKRIIDLASELKIERKGIALTENDLRNAAISFGFFLNVNRFVASDSEVKNHVNDSGGCILC